MTANQHCRRSPREVASPRQRRKASAVLPGPAVAGWARDTLTEAVPAMADKVTAVHLLRAGVKRLAVVDIEGGRPVVLKQYSDARGAGTLRWLQRLAESGFAPPARFGVSPARGWSSSHRTLVTEVAAGSAWTCWLHGPAKEREATAVAAADWVSTLQSLSVVLPDRSTYRAAEDLHRDRERLTERYPEFTARLRRVGESVHCRLYRNGAGGTPELVPSHGDPHPDNLYLATGEQWLVAAIDVDTAGMRRPAYDVGYALAQLLIASWMRTGSFQAGAGAGLAFWRRWLAGRAPDATAVPAEVARALLQSLHFELVTYYTGRTELMGHWLNVAEAVLDCGVDVTLAGLGAEQKVAL